MWKALYTMVENGKKNRQNSHLIIHCPTSEGVSEVSERSGGRERSEQSGVSGASERASGGVNGPVPFASISQTFYPTCSGH